MISLDSPEEPWKNDRWVKQNIETLLDIDNVSNGVFVGCLELFINPVELIGLHNLNVRGNVVLGAEIDTFLVIGKTSNAGTSNGFSASHQVHLHDLVRSKCNSDKDKSSISSQKGNVSVNIMVC